MIVSGKGGVDCFTVGTDAFCFWGLDLGNFGHEVFAQGVRDSDVDFFLREGLFEGD